MKVFTVTAHYGSGSTRTLPDAPRSEALRFMRGCLKYDARATFTVQGPHRPAPARPAVWV